MFGFWKMKRFSDSVFRKSSEKCPYNMLEIHSLENASSFLKGSRASQTPTHLEMVNCWMLNLTLHRYSPNNIKLTSENRDIRRKNGFLSHAQVRLGQKLHIHKAAILSTSNTYTPTYTLTALIINS